MTADARTDLSAGKAAGAVRPWDSIPVKLISGILFLTVIVGLSVWSIVARQQEQLFFEQRSREAVIQLAEITKDFTERMLGGGGKAVWSVLTADAIELTRKNRAARVLVFRADGSVMSASERALVGTRLQVKDNPACPACDSQSAADFPAAAIVPVDGGRMLRVINPIPVTDTCRMCHRRDDEVHSFIAADFDLSSLERAREERQRGIFSVGLLSSFVLVALVTLLFRRLVMRPIDALGASMQRLAAGDLGARTAAAGRDELALLGRHFNHMAAQIEDQVARIEAAHTESELLYKLVLEASKDLETNEVAAGVLRVIVEKLSPARAAFFLESAESGWTCASGGRECDPVLQQGSGTLEAALAAAVPPEGLEGIPPGLIAAALRTRSPQLVDGAGDACVVLPVVSESRLLGLLACAGVPRGIGLDRDQLENIAVHLVLTAANSRNYTGAITDALTRLKNKRYGVARLEESVSFAHRHGSTLGVLMCDIDHFKRVNDTYGHPVGDLVLQEVSRRIAGCVRKSDICARYGGEEFLLILPQTGIDALAVVGEKIRQAVAAQPVRAAGTDLRITLSAGVALYRGADDSGDAMIARADAALYRAKAGGRDRVVLDVA